MVDGAGAYLLPRRIGMQRAKEMAFLGGQLPAAAALAYGLVNRVVPYDELDSAAEDLAGQLARAATSAIALTKRLLNSHSTRGASRRSCWRRCPWSCKSKADDVTEGVSAFMERREPQFTGH